MKQCKKCGQTKPLSEYYKASGAADGHRSECKDCAKAIRHAYYLAHRGDQIARAQAWREANPERYRETQSRIRKRRVSEQRADHLRRAFGMTVDAYEELFAAQGGVCAICGRAPEKVSLHVDHDHSTGEIRGLLCFRCNNALGLFRDDAVLLYAAYQYRDEELGDRLATSELVLRTRARAGGLRETPV